MKENKVGERSWCWDVRAHQKRGEGERKEGSKEGRREKENKIEGFCKHGGDDGCLGGIFKGQIYVPYSWDPIFGVGCEMSMEAGFESQTYWERC